MKIKLSEITAGDRITLLSGSGKSSYRRTRTVRGVTATGVKIRFGKQLLVLPLAGILSLEKVEERGAGGITDISREMYRKGITNTMASDKSGYCVRTVSDVRLGKRVLPRSLKDIQETVAGWKN
jgi:hypothetical protein